MASEGAYTLRPAVKTDVPSILKLIKALAAYEKQPGAVEATEELLEQNLFGEGNVANAVLAVHESTQEAVGMALYFFNFSTWTGKAGIYLEDLFVEPDYRHAGLGKRLFAELGKIAEKRGCVRIDWVVLKWNEPSIKFYERLGAKAQSEWEGFRLSGEGLKALKDLA